MTITKEVDSKPWSMYSWKDKPIKHQPTYTDTEELASVLEDIENAPKIVDVQDICILKDQIKQ